MSSWVLLYQSIEMFLCQAFRSLFPKMMGYNRKGNSGLPSVIDIVLTDRNMEGRCGFLWFTESSSSDFDADDNEDRNYSASSFISSGHSLSMAWFIIVSAMIWWQNLSHQMRMHEMFFTVRMGRWGHPNFSIGCFFVFSSVSLQSVNRKHYYMAQKSG